MPNDDTQQTQKTAVQVKTKGTKRWQRVMSSNSGKQNILIPQKQLLNGPKSFEYDTGEKKSFLKKFRATVRKMFPFYQKTSKKLKRQGNSPPNPVIEKENAVPNKHHFLPRTIREFSYPRVFPKLKRKLSQNAIQLDVDIVEEHAESVSGTNRVVQARRMTRRISVVSLPPGIRKASYPATKKNFAVFKKKKKKSIPSTWYHSDMTVEHLQMQVDNLLDNVSEKSIQLLALRSAELQQCESLGDKILQSSKQFQRVSLRTTKKHKLKNMCFPCRCCC